MKGKFIVIEGIDGCGKTTQIDELSRWLPSSGLIKKGSKLITTVIELIAINNAAIEGVRRIPYLGNKMPEAKGIASKL